MSSATRAKRLQFHIGSIALFFKSGKYALGTGAGAPFYVAAILEYFAVEELEFFGLSARDNKKRPGTIIDSTPQLKESRNCLRYLPKRIILVRHGESKRNMAAYATMPDHRIPLTALGVEQAHSAGERIKQLVSEGGQSSQWSVHFYVSPYEVTLSTLREIGRAFPPEKVIGSRNEYRIQEQNFGHLPVVERMKVIKLRREHFDRFFYRFPGGESSAEVFDRVASFISLIWTDINLGRLDLEGNTDVNLVIVLDELTAQIFLMRWFKWTVNQFERLNNLGSCELQVLQLGPSEDYSLVPHHSTDELRRWGLSAKMIAEQQWRATAVKGSWFQNCPWRDDDFFGQPKEELKQDTDDESSDDC